MLSLWLISQTKTRGYDTFDSAVVVAETAEQAERIHPNERAGEWWLDHPNGHRNWNLLDWSHPKYVSATKIGDALPDAVAGTVICASFNAG